MPDTPRRLYRATRRCRPDSPPSPRPYPAIPRLSRHPARAPGRGVEPGDIRTAWPGLDSRYLATPEAGAARWPGRARPATPHTRREEETPPATPALRAR